MHAFCLYFSEQVSRVKSGVVQGFKYTRDCVTEVVSALLSTFLAVISKPPSTADNARLALCDNGVPVSPFCMKSAEMPWPLDDDQSTLFLSLEEVAGELERKAGLAL